MHAGNRVFPITFYFKKISRHTPQYQTHVYPLKATKFGFVMQILEVLGQQGAKSCLAPSFFGDFVFIINTHLHTKNGSNRTIQ